MADHAVPYIKFDIENPKDEFSRELTTKWSIEMGEKYKQMLNKFENNLFLTSIHVHTIMIQDFKIQN